MKELRKLSLAGVVVGCSGLGLAFITNVAMSVNLQNALALFFLWLGLMSVGVIIKLIKKQKYEKLSYGYWVEAMPNGFNFSLL